MARKKSNDTTELNQELFITAFGVKGTILGACKESGVSRATYYNWFNKNVNGFRDKMVVAQEIYRESVHEILLERLMNQKFDSNPVLLIFEMKNIWPERYGDRGVTDEAVKEVMQEWKKWKKDSKKTENTTGVNEAEEARKSAINEVEKLLVRKKTKNDDNTKA